jgi:hypothetical protein
MLFVCLNILPELVFAVSVEIHRLTGDDSPRAKVVGHTVGVGESIEPIYAVLGHLDDESGWHVGEW